MIMPHIHNDIYLLLGPPVQFSLGVEGGLYNDSSRGAYVIVSGSSLILSCSFQADPLPSMTWKFNTNRLQSSSKHEITHTFADNPPIGYGQHNLTVRNIDQTDSGNYTCEVKNMYGTGQIAQTVAVIGK